MTRFPDEEPEITADDWADREDRHAIGHCRRCGHLHADRDCPTVTPLLLRSDT